MVLIPPRLEAVQPSGKAAQFVAASLDPGAGTFFLALRRSEAPAAAEDEELCDGDLLAVAAETDAEPGDLVVWWAGTVQSQALARVGPDLVLEPLAGFPPPPPAATLRGVVVGRLRRLAPE